MVLRFDTGRLGIPCRLDNGYLRADGRITRIGVFPYRLGDGTIRHELRTPYEVFNADAIDSFDIAPLTNDHPPEQLTASNTRKYSVGTVTKVRRDGEFVRADIVIMDEASITEAEAGKRELSCGYRCDLDMTPGVTAGLEGIPDGIRFDAIQRSIRGNHVAIVERGRMGRKTSLRLDAEDAVLVTHADIAPQKQSKEPAMVKVTIDGVDFEVAEQAAQAIAKLQARADSVNEETASARKDAETEKARADKAEEERDAAIKDRNDAADPKAIRARVDARLTLERSATRILGNESKLDEMDDAAIKRAVIVKVSPTAEAKLDGCSDEYLDARFDAAVEAKPEDEDEDEDKKKKGKAPLFTRKASKDSDDADRFDEQAARERMLEANFNRGRQPLSAKAH